MLILDELVRCLQGDMRIFADWNDQPTRNFNMRRIKPKFHLKLGSMSPRISRSLDSKRLD